MCFLDLDLSRSHPIYEEQRQPSMAGLPQKTVKRAPIVGGGRVRHNLHSSVISTIISTVINTVINTVISTVMSTVISTVISTVTIIVTIVSFNVSNNKSLILLSSGTASNVIATVLPLKRECTAYNKILIIFCLNVQTRS